MQKFKKQQTPNFIYHAIPICVSETNLPLKCHIYATYPNYFMSTYGTELLSHMKFWTVNMGKYWVAVLLTEPRPFEPIALIG